MGNPLYKQFGGQPAQPAQQAPQPMDVRQAMSQLQANTAEMIRQAGYNVPPEIANDPHAAAMHIIQSGQVKSPVLQRLQPLINMLSGRR